MYATGHFLMYSRINRARRRGKVVVAAAVIALSPWAESNSMWLLINRWSSTQWWWGLNIEPTNHADYNAPDRQVLRKVEVIFIEWQVLSWLT